MPVPVHRIAIKPSARLAAALVAIHGGASAAIWFAPLPLPVKAGASLAIAASLAWTLWHSAALRAKTAVVELETRDGGSLFCRMRVGAWHQCELLGSSYVSPWLTVLGLRAVGARLPRHVVLMPDNVDADDFRRLRTWLRWSAPPVSGPGPR